MFDDLLEANHEFQKTFQDSGLPGRAARSLAVLTCIDSRIDPLAMLGLRPGDAKIIRNAGARVTDDALRSLVLATNLLDAKRVCIVQHTDCAMAGSTERGLRERIFESSAVDPLGWDFLAMEDQVASMRSDCQRIRDCDLIPDDTEIGMFLFDVHTGELSPIAM